MTEHRKGKFGEEKEKLKFRHDFHGCKNRSSEQRNRLEVKNCSLINDNYNQNTERNRAYGQVHFSSHLGGQSFVFFNGFEGKDFS